MIMFLKKNEVFNLKLSRLFTSLGALLVIAGIFSSFIGPSAIYLTDNIAMATNEEINTVVEVEDLTKLAYHVDNVTGDEDIKKVATNIREDIAQPEFNDNMRLYLAYRQILETEKKQLILKEWKYLMDLLNKN